VQDVIRMLIETHCDPLAAYIEESCWPTGAEASRRTPPREGVTLTQQCASR